MMYRILHFIPTSATLFLLTAPVLAAEESAGNLIKTGLISTGEKAGYKGSPGLPVLIGNVIQALLGVVGIIFLVLIVYGGFLYMTDIGVGDKVKKAKSIIATSLIGLIIVIAAYAFADFVITELVKATSGGQPG